MCNYNLCIPYTILPFFYGRVHPLTKKKNILFGQENKTGLIPTNGIWSDCDLDVVTYIQHYKIIVIYSTYLRDHNHR